MGWHSSDAPAHEGFSVALVERLVGDAYRDHMVMGFRELVSPYEPPHDELHHACAGCSCGWRSAWIKVAESMSWDDGYLKCSEHVRTRLDRLWEQHIALCAYEIRIAHDDEPVARARASLLLVQQLEGVERCKCGHERREHGLGEPGGEHRMCVAYVGSEGRRCSCRDFRFMPSPA